MGWLWRNRLKRKHSLSSIVMPDDDTNLLADPSRAAERHTLHPRLWLALGSSYIVIGILQVVLAALWRNWFGLALGFGIAKMGTSLCGMTLAARPPPPPGRGCLGWLKSQGRRLLMWGASKVQALFFFFRWLVYGYGLVVLLMVLIRLASADYLWAGFPNECPSDKRFGCSRIAESNPHGARHLTPLHLAAAMPDVQAQAEAWIAASAQARLLKDSRPGFLHARYLTWFWGFADDFMVSLRCNELQQTVVEVQGQLRLGKSDLGVNGRRNEHFMLDLSQAVQQGAIPQGACMQDPPEQATTGRRR